MSGVLDYSTDGATWTGLTGATLTPGTGVSGTYTATMAGGLPVGVWNAYVRNHNSQTQIGETAAPFAVTAASPVALPTIANHVLSIQPDVGLSNLFVDIALTTQAAIGSTAGGIKDRTGTGNNYLNVTGQTPSIVAPVFVSSVKNGLPALQFVSATNNFARIAAGAPLPPMLQTSAGWTIAAFFTVPTLPGSGLYYEVVQFCQTGAFWRIRVFVNPTGTITARLYDDTNAIVAALTSPSGVSAGATNMLIFGWDGTNFKMTLNAQAEQSAVPTSHTLTLAWGDAWIGASRSGGATWAGQATMNLLGLECWNTAYSTANATALVTYGTSKWGA